jgi:hypothetical protein
MIIPNPTAPPSNTLIQKKIPDHFLFPPQQPSGSATVILLHGYGASIRQLERVLDHTSNLQKMRKSVEVSYCDVGMNPEQNLP